MTLLFHAVLRLHVHVHFVVIYVHVRTCTGGIVKESLWLEENLLTRDIQIQNRLQRGQNSSVGKYKSGVHNNDELRAHQLMLHAGLCQAFSPSVVIHVLGSENKYMYMYTPYIQINGAQYPQCMHYVHSCTCTCQYPRADSNQKDNEPPRASIPKFLGPTPPAQLSVLVQSLVPETISVPISHPVNGVEIIIVPAVYTSQL